jgi:hypothetical protein
MMLGSSSVAKSTMGTNTRGSAPLLFTWYCSSLSMVISMGLLQWAQVVCSVKESLSFRSCPCTKGVAIASIPQAA